MQFKVKLSLYSNYNQLLRILSLLVLVFGIGGMEVKADKKFQSKYQCSDTPRVCQEQKGKIISGVYVSPPCWSYAYTKTCQYPSKDNCRDYSHCYAVANLPCLLRDSYGNCVNLQKEFSCKSWQPVTIDKEMVRTGLIAKEGKERLVCKGVPCIDGNCVDKSYLTNDEMMDSVSKLYAVSQMKEAKDMNTQLFAGFAQSCSKKAASYTNCCSTSLKGWGQHLGARCTADEIDLVNKRQKNLCVYVGKENKQTMGVTTVVKHHYCCFGGLLNKVIQVEGRRQLGIGFGSGGRPDCRGLTLAEILRLDFEKMDFSEFFQDILKRMKIPQTSDINSRVSSSLPNIRKYDGNPNNSENNKSGWHSNIKDDSWEAEEEKRIEEERQRELARLEAIRQEEERQRELARQEEARRLEAVRQIELARLAAVRMEQERQREVAAKAERKKLMEQRIEMLKVKGSEFYAAARKAQDDGFSHRNQWYYAGPEAEARWLERSKKLQNDYLVNMSKAREVSDEYYRLQNDLRKGNY